MRPAAFIDRDGTLNEHIPFPGEKPRSPSTPEEVVLMEGVAEPLGRLSRAGYLVLMVTNQPGVAKGHFTLDRMDRVNAQVKRLIEAGGGHIDAIYSCPHHPTEGSNAFVRVCDCRKPAPGLLLRAAKEWDADLVRSVMIGDSEVDVRTAMAAGCRSVVVGSAGGFTVAPDAEFDTLASGCEWVMRHV